MKIFAPCVSSKIRPLITTLIFVVVVVGGLSGCRWIGQSGEPATSSTAADPAEITTTVIRVVDGDTITVAVVPGVLDDNTPDTKRAEHTVRVLGINTPELHSHEPGFEPDCGAVEATDHLKKLLPSQTPVTLRFDARSDHTDRYGRSLAYLGSATTADVGLAQIQAGYAVAYYPKSEPAPERDTQYRSAAEVAKKSNVGSYSHCH